MKKGKGKGGMKKGKRMSVFGVKFTLGPSTCTAEQDATCNAQFKATKTPCKKFGKYARRFMGRRRLSVPETAPRRRFGKLKKILADAPACAQSAAAITKECFQCTCPRLKKRFRNKLKRKLQKLENTVKMWSKILVRFKVVTQANVDTVTSSIDTVQANL